jgi:hypothetical protein
MVLGENRDAVPRPQAVALGQGARRAPDEAEMLGVADAPVAGDDELLVAVGRGGGS